MSEWQPIETAPKDRSVLLYEPIGGWWLPEPRPGVVPHIWVGNWWKGDTLNRAQWNGAMYSAPTHWMPLPAPPTEIETGNPASMEPASPLRSEAP